MGSNATDSERPLLKVIETGGLALADDRSHPSREALLGAPTEQSVGLVLEAAQHAENTGSTAIESLELFLHQTIDRGPELVLPMHGGLVRLDPQMIALRNDVHDTLTRILKRGQREGVVSLDVTAFDIVIFGAQLARPLPHVRDWQHAARRLVQTFLTGITAPTCRPRIEVRLLDDGPDRDAVAAERS